MTGDRKRRRLDPVSHGGTDPALLIHVEIMFDRIDAALIVLRNPAAKDLTLDL